MLLVNAIYNKKYQEMSFELKNLFTGPTQNSGLEKIVVIMKNEAVQLFSKIMDDTVGAEAKMARCFIKNVPSFLALVSAIRENNVLTKIAGRV